MKAGERRLVDTLRLRQAEAEQDMLDHHLLHGS
jgi:hypothetical protein